MQRCPRTGSRTVHTTLRRGALPFLLALALAGCSDGSADRKADVIPAPKPGKLSTFALSAIDKKGDLDSAAENPHSSVVSDRSGNIYALNGDDSPSADVLKVTPAGEISRFSRIDSNYGSYGMATAGNDGVFTAGPSGLLHIDRHGTTKPLTSPDQIKHPQPIGMRPDGSFIVVDGSSVWALKGAQAAKVYALPKKEGIPSGTVDADGAIYLQTKKSNEIVILTPGGNPRSLALTGKLPGFNKTFSALSVFTMTPAYGHDGVYATLLDVDSAENGSAYIAHIKSDGSVTALAKGTAGNANCRPKQSYPALDSPCFVPWHVVQSNSRVIAMGGPSVALEDKDHPYPALVVPAPAN
jgi:hypothetical protein